MHGLKKFLRVFLPGMLVGICLGLLVYSFLTDWGREFGVPYPDEPEDYPLCRVFACMLGLVCAYLMIQNAREKHSTFLRLAAIEATADGLGLVDPEGCLAYANKSLMALHGLNEQDMRDYIGQSWEKLYTEKGKRAIREKVMPALRRDGVWRGEAPILRKDGSVLLAEMSLTLLEDGSLVGTARDITARRKMESDNRQLQEQFAQAQKMEAVGQLTGGVAHDFNNILTALSGNIQCLEDFCEQVPDMKPFVAACDRGVRRGSELTQRLLSFSRKQVLAPQTVNINDLVTGIETLIARVLRKDISLQFDLAADISSTRIDPGQFENALLNLAINARDAMPDGGTLIIESSNVVLEDQFAGRRSDDRKGPHVLIAVTDTGSGMSPAVVKRVFEPFFTTKGEGKGTGLGLSMVYGFVTQSGGFVAIESEEGKGTTVKLYFPVTAS